MSLRLVTTSFALTFALACNSVPVPGSQHITLHDGQTLGGGRMEVQSFVVERGATVRVTEDLVVESRGGVQILGRLIAADRTGMALLRDAPDITITSHDMIEVDGEIAGGHGYGFDAAAPLIAPGDGGQGTTITLRAPQIWIDGAVRAGAGGRGNIGGRGGAGGDVVIEGRTQAHDGSKSVATASGKPGRGVGAAADVGRVEAASTHARIFGGDGGDAGPRGAGQASVDGGTGGKVTASEYKGG